ncbi:hypothetical protein JKP88DRAFT_261793 [Tribonema minus]|uniref:Uncharacterized protein n=1 Tax=Tribonema minus TaxID=303371 RepID=A0A836CQG2_9STRA|nr:hypothetical protein JKP88DRAFT_261793 [Tribonema minus]
MHVTAAAAAAAAGLMGRGGGCPCPRTLSLITCRAATSRGMSTKKKNGGRRERLTNLERHALQRRRWLRDDPSEDLNVYSFEEQPTYKKVPEDMVIGHISNNLKWAIYQAHKEDPVKNSVVNLSNKHQLARTRIEIIIQQKEWFLQDLARGKPWGEKEQQEAAIIDEALLESAKLEHEDVETVTGEKVPFRFRDLPIPVGRKIDNFAVVLDDDTTEELEVHVEVVLDDDTTEEFEVWKREKHEQVIEKIERRLGDVKMKKIERRAAGARILESTILKNAPKIPVERRWNWVMKDTSLQGAPSVIRTKQGDLRLCTLEEDMKRSWRNEF